jgi:hypothetical protein
VDLWSRFFKDADPNLFSIYSHPKFPKQVTQSIIKDHIIDKYYPTEKYTISEIEVQLGLLSAAYHSGNHKAILISNSCIPLHRFDYVYNYLTQDNKGHIGLNLGVNFADIQNSPHPHVKAKLQRCMRRRYRGLRVKRFVPFHEFVKHRNEGQCFSRSMMKFYLENDFTPLFKMRVQCEHYFGLIASELIPDDWFHVNNLTHAVWPVYGHVREFDHLKPKLIDQAKKDFLFFRKVKSGCTFAKPIL